jgi:hypothetical protein
MNLPCEDRAMARFKTDYDLGKASRLERIGSSGWGLHVPFNGTIELSEKDALGDIFAVVAMTIDLVDGILQPTVLRVVARDGRPVTGTMLRQLPLRGMANELIYVNIGKLQWSDGNSSFAYGGGISIEEAERERIRQQGPTDESLRMMADLYELGRLVGLNPAKFVETNLGMPRTTVTKWVRRARDRGMIGGDDGEHQEA